MSQHENAIERSKSKVDEGLRKYMNGIYARMAAGVLITALVAMAVGTSPVLLKLFMGGPQAYIIAFAPMAIVWFGFNPQSMSSGKLQGVFFLISGLYGVSFSTIAFMASGDPAFMMDVARAFFIAVGMFAGLSIYGYTTKKDLSGMRQFLVMAVWGVVAMSVANIFMASSGFSLIISAIAIPVFAGITLWETQQLRRQFSAFQDPEITSRLAWSGALTLYISFIAIFIHLLNLLSRR